MLHTFQKQKNSAFFTDSPIHQLVIFVYAYSFENFYVFLFFSNLLSFFKKKSVCI